MRENNNLKGKELSELTLKELWDLFPIFLVKPDDKWKDYYRDMEAEIGGLLTAVLLKESVTSEVRQ